MSGSRLLTTLLVVMMIAPWTAPAATAATSADAIRAEYKAVLLELSRTEGEDPSGNLEPALAALYEMETGALGESPTVKAIEGLWRLKIRTVRELIQNESLDLLVPIIVFHHEAVTMYRKRHHPSLTVHSRTMVEELVDYQAGKVEDDKIRVFGGWVMASLGALALEAKSYTRGSEYFRRAIDLDPANGYAVLVQGALLEKYGDYYRAGQYFRKRLAFEPNHAESRLRLALCLLRLRDTPALDLKKAEAIDLLKHLTSDGEAPDWVRRLAFQELAAARARDGKMRAAEGVVLNGLARYPNDQNLLLQLIALLERRGALEEASQRLESIAALPTEAESPRWLYDRFPRGGLEEARATMLRMMQNRLPKLATSLGATTRQTEQVSP